MKLTTRNKFLKAAALLPTPCGNCKDDELLSYGNCGVVVIGAQSIDPFEIRVTSTHLESKWRICETCGAAYFKNDHYNVFEQTWTNVGGNTIGSGIKIAIPSRETATVRIYVHSTEFVTPPAVKNTDVATLVREFKPKFDSNGHCGIFV